MIKIRYFCFICAALAKWNGKRFLAIPADKEQMELAKRNWGIQEFSECQWNQYGGPLDESSVIIFR